MSDIVQLAAGSGVLALDGQNIANKLEGIIAPIAALFIGVYSLRYLRGDDRSLALFLGYLAIAACVYAMISFGYEILGVLSGFVQSLFQ
ncbi:hypothetical protein [Virgisporangium aurantiacum]|uniref:hypothetical protein n=1 Tax=Virgisporangium aurantiacum TaxID=175570 RepID=UPI001951AD91|nr:hypothetical protein [Virgisporangium aurantiacum]